jgi:hypothetical protein
MAQVVRVLKVVTNMVDFKICCLVGFGPPLSVTFLLSSLCLTEFFFNPPY